jgi:hypothetical protein
MGSDESILRSDLTFYYRRPLIPAGRYYQPMRFRRLLMWAT